MRTLCKIALALVALGCAEGRTPPAPTAMVPFNDGDGTVTYTFGAAEPCCTAGLNFCTNGTVPNEAQVCQLERPDPVYPAMTVKIPGFELDAHEVTNLQYQHCVARGACSEPQAVNALGGGRYDKYYDEDSDEFANFPVIRVTFNQAQEYCEFVGKRLPTEFEWAAAAQSANARYPWGDTPAECQADGAQVGIKACQSEQGFPQAVTSSSTDVVGTPGGSVYDLAGNVSEWTTTIYQADITCESPITAFADTTKAAQPPCNSSFVVCGDESTPSGFAGCATQHRTCGACYDPDAATPELNPACFGICVEQTATHWVCGTYGDTVVENPTSSATGGQRVIRGASYNTTDLCEARLDWRLNRSLDQAKAEATVGFRCARDL